MRRKTLIAAAWILVAAAASAADLEEEYDRLARRVVPRDRFPVLNNPKMTPAKLASEIRDDEPVIGVAIGKEAKAYPISVMGIHELANDVCGDVPIAVSW